MVKFQQTSEAFPVENRPVAWKRIGCVLWEQQQVFLALVRSLMKAMMGQIGRSVRISIRPVSGLLSMVKSKQSSESFLAKNRSITCEWIRSVLRKQQ
jgi:hypothetical protein